MWTVWSSRATEKEEVSLVAVHSLGRRDMITVPVSLDCVCVPFPDTVLPSFIQRETRLDIRVLLSWFYLIV